MNDFLTNKLFPFFRLIRFPNLLVIIITMYLLRFAIILPIYGNAGYAPSMDNLVFALLVLSVVMIAGAGYIINDYFDLKTDRFNKPDRVLLGQYFSRRRAIFFHIVLNFLAIIAGFYVAWESGSLSIGFIFPMTAFLLWLYSVRYKRMVLWGNIVVAFLSAFVIIVVWLFEFLALRSLPETFVALMGSMGLITRFIIAYALFAFMVSLIREVIKDAEDIKGDGQTGCLTFPVVYGQGAARMLALYLSIVTLVLLILAIWWFFRLEFLAVAIYLIIAALLPLVFILFRLKSATEKRDFSLLSNLWKLLMLAGILSMVPLSFML
ncbi:MAG: geranylgeranylglycerol-phosphate geranylgeranyltransferase [Lentimicrobium sp.]|nr:geranylgeranylglycerol-phosphate geranylgeranyltransferase [Lentimicrobium sp.]